MRELKTIDPRPSGKGESTHGNGNLNVEQAVRERYSKASQQAAPALCCPVDYDPRYLDALPKELIDRDYGCGDPSRHLRSGETVLDLGSGGGKICYIAAQVVGAAGRVIGVDANDEMLSLARRFQSQIGDSLGFHNVEFRKGRIQDLALDLEVFEHYLQEHPVHGGADWLRAQEHASGLRQSQPLIASDSIDVVVSNCVLNLVSHDDRRQLFSEIFRVLRRGGRAVISDITCDEPVPVRLQQNAELWSGCLSGAFLEEAFLEAFAEAGFHGIGILSREEKPWATIEGIEFRSVTVEAFKGKQGPCKDHNQAVIYRGPWKSVTDDDGHILRRGVRTAVCEKTFNIYMTGPYAGDVIPVPPHYEVDPEQAADYDCHRGAVRHPRETKGAKYDKTELPEGDCCNPNCC